MKRMKVTKRPAGRETFVLEPSRLRLFAIYTLVFTLAISIGFLVRLLVNPNGLQGIDWLVIAAGVLGGALIMAFLERSRWVIRVRADTLEGTTGIFGERLTIPLKEIDWARTRRSLSSGFKIGNSIYANQIRRIMISPWFFDPRRYQEFLTAIGYDKAILRLPAAEKRKG